MHYLIKRIAGLLSVVIIVSAMSGCKAIVDSNSKAGSDTTEQYTTEVRMNELDYKMFVNERITNTQFLIQTRLNITKNINAKEFPVNDEITNTEAALTDIQKYIKEITVTRPPMERDADRERLLQCMLNVESTMQTYLKYLQENNLTKAQDSVSVLKGDYATLSTLCL